MAFGDSIRQARKKKELSLKSLSEKILNEEGKPITPQYLNDIELNRRLPSPVLIGQIAKQLGLDADMLHALAGRIPPKAIENHSDERIETAMKLFRKALRK